MGVLPRLEAMATCVRKEGANLLVICVREGGIEGKEGGTH